MNYRKAFRLSQTFGVLGALVIVVTRFIDLDPVLSAAAIALGILLVIVALIIHFSFVKCPFCKKRLSANRRPERCPHCGGKLI